MSEPATLAIASRLWLGRILYVSHLPGDGGTDWGYDDRVSRAEPLKPYWQRRFAADMRYVGASFTLVEIENKESGDEL